MQNTEASSATCYLPTTPQAILNPEQQASQVLPVAVAVAAGAELAGGGFGFGMSSSSGPPYTCAHGGVGARVVGGGKRRGRRGGGREG